MLGATRQAARMLSTRRRGEPFRVVEVGPRDGLQSEKTFVPTATKIALIDRLSACGLPSVEATSFVSPKWVPQLADHDAVIRGIRRRPGTDYPVLVPNMAGLNNALATGCVSEVAVFGSASDAFSKKNVNATSDEALAKLIDVTNAALKAGVRVRGYVSCVVGCPYEGRIKSSAVVRVAEKLLSAGCYEVSLGDTIGVGTAGSVAEMLDDVLKAVPAKKVAVHFHDTYGQALANVLVAVEKGIRTADASVSGLGGCPYAKGATGNLATEDLLYLLEGLGFETGVSLEDVVRTSRWFNEQIGRQATSKVAAAIKLQ